MEHAINPTKEIALKGRSQKLQVLFVDNNPSDHLYDLIGEINFDNVIVNEAVTKISERQIRYDAVVVDASIDTIDIRMLRMVTNESDLPLILYTSFFDEKIKVMALKLKADDYLSGSMRYSLGNQVGLIKQMRRLNVQWLKQESNHRVKEYALPSAWHFFQRRTTDVTISFFALMLLSPLLFVLVLVQEIKLMEAHVFGESKNEMIGGSVFNWYQFIVLILYAPLLAIIKLPLKILSQRQLCCLDQNRASRLDKILPKKAVEGLLYLHDILKGDTTLFKDTLNSLQHELHAQGSAFTLR